MTVFFAVLAAAAAYVALVKAPLPAAPAASVWAW